MSRTYHKQPDFLGPKVLSGGSVTKVVTVVDDCFRTEKTPRRKGVKYVSING